MTRLRSILRLGRTDRPAPPRALRALPAHLRLDIGLPAVDGVDDDVARHLRKIEGW